MRDIFILQLFLPAVLVWLSMVEKHIVFFIACHYCVIYFMKLQQLWKQDTIIITQS